MAQAQPLIEVLRRGCNAFIQYCNERSWCQKLLEIIITVTPEDETHGVNHVLRVTCLATYLATIEHADLDVVIASSLLHDIGRPLEDQINVHHAIASGYVARLLLDLVDFPKDKIEHVINAIITHSFSLGRSPSSLEGLILSDADKIDALGFIGVVRALANGFKTGRGLKGTLKHYHEKLSRLYDLIRLTSAKRIARQLQDDIDKFFREIEQVYTLTEKILRGVKIDYEKTPIHSP